MTFTIDPFTLGFAAGAFAATVALFALAWWAARGKARGR